MTASARFSRITGTGSYLPPRRVTNAELAARAGDARHRNLGSMDRRAHRHPRAPFRRRRRDGERPGARSLAPCARSRPDARRRRSTSSSSRTSTPDMVFPSTATHPAAQARRRRLPGVRSAGGVLGLRLRVDGGRFDDPHRRRVARAGDRQRGVLAHPRLQRPHDLRAVRRRRRRGGARGQRSARHPGRRDLHADGAYRDILCTPGTVAGGKVLGDPLLKMDGPAVFKLAVQRARGIGARRAGCEPAAAPRLTSTG